MNHEAAGRLLKNFLLNLLDAVCSAALPEPADGCGAMLLMWDAVATPVLSLGPSSWTILQHGHLFVSCWLLPSCCSSHFLSGVLESFSFPVFTSDSWQVLPCLRCLGALFSADLSPWAFPDTFAAVFSAAPCCAEQLHHSVSPCTSCFAHFQQPCVDGRALGSPLLLLWTLVSSLLSSFFALVKQDHLQGLLAWATS